MIRMLAVLILALALLPTAALAHEGTEVTVRGDVRPGGPIDIVGEEFEPNDIVRIELRKDGVEPIELGRIPADGEGAFTETLHVPADVRPGLYQLAADGEESATFDVIVLDPTEGAPEVEPTGEAQESASNNRPAGETLGLTIFTGVIGLAAVALLWASRTHAGAAGG